MKKLTLLLACILSVCGLFAQHVTEEQAMQKAQAFMQGKAMSNIGGPKHAPVKPRAMKRVAQATENDALYLFNVEDNGGFVIVSGDDRTEEILGYSTEGNIDPQTMPENMREWLKGYEEQIKAIPANATAMPAKVPTHPAIEPLVTAKWNQGAPYNLQCPEETPESSTESQHCVTGCVATAMAQIMYYWKWPQDYTTAIPAYEYGGTWNEEIQNFNNRKSLPELPPTQFDWTNMKDEYDYDETGVAADAVAQLMRYCGQSLHMDYGLSSSGCTLADLYWALKRTFSYDEGINEVGPVNYSISGWDNLLYSELLEKRPIIIFGCSHNQGCHALICDGYDGTGMYHINWGWGDYFNGFFKLSILNPYHNSYNDKFSFSISYGSALIGIQPTTGNIIEKPLFEAYIYTLDAVELNKEVGATFIYNGSETMYMDFAIGLLTESGEITNVCMLYENVEVIERNSPETDLSWGAFLTLEEMGLSDGTYCFVALYKQHSEIEWTIGSKMERTISDGEFLPTMEAKSLKLEIVDIQYGFLSEQQAYIDVTLNNLGDEQWIQSRYEVSMADHPTYSSEEWFDWPGWTDIQIEEESTTTIRLVFTPEESGTYNFWIVTSDATTVIAQGSVIVNPSKMFLKGNNIDWSDMLLNVTVTNGGDEPYDREVAVRVYPREDYGKDIVGQVFKSEKLHIEPRQSVDVDIDCTGLSIDNLYLADLMYCKNPNSDIMINYNAGIKLDMVNKGQFTVNGIQYVIADTERHYVFASKCIADAPTQLTVPATVVSPEDGVSYTVKGISQAFCNYNDVTDLSFSYGITTIRSYAVQGCESLETVVLPGSLNRIEAGMIYQCPNLKTIYSKAHEAPLLVDYGVSNYLIGWDEKYDDITLYVPIGSRDSYAKSWTQFTNIVEMDIADMPSTTSDDQVSDLTALVGVTAEDWHAGGMVGWAGPEVTTNDGRTTPLAEVYEETTETTGTVMEQTVTGLENGLYCVTLYANACYTPGRGFDSDIIDGQTDVVYLFANDAIQYIPAYITDRVAEHGEYTLTTTVTNGTLHLGMVAEKPGTNWHSIQIKSLEIISGVETVPVGKALVAGYSSDKALDFTGSDVTAWIATGFRDGKIMLSKVDVVPANTGIYVKSTKAGEFDIPTTTEKAYYVNMFQPVVTARTVQPTETVDGVTYQTLSFALSQTTGQPAFFPNTAEKTYGDNKMYLRLPEWVLDGAARLMDNGEWIMDKRGEVTDVSTGDTEPVTIGTLGVAGFSSNRNLDFTNSDVEAWIATGFKGGNVMLSRVYAVPAGTGVYVKSKKTLTQQTTFQIPVTTELPYYVNAFVGLPDGGTVHPTETVGGVTMQTLSFAKSQSTGKPAFFPNTADKTYGAGKMYLRLPADLVNSSDAARGLNFVFEGDELPIMGETTGISDASHLNDKGQMINDKRGGVYNLNGQRVQTSNFFDERSGKAERKVQTSKLKKGLYIVNGKKVVIK